MKPPFLRGARSPSPRPIRTLTVDDEPIARLGLRREIERDPELSLVGECAHGQQAVDAIKQLRPELVVLDLQLPGLDGFGVVEAIGAERMPALIFATAYDQHAHVAARARHIGQARSAPRAGAVSARACSTIVNVSRIQALEPVSHGEYRIVLRDGTSLTSGRTYRERLDRLVTSSF